MSFFDASNFVVHDNAAFRIGSFAVNWYGIIIACATLLAVVICMKRAHTVGLKEDNVVDLALVLIPSAIVGARLYYVAFEWDMFKGDLLSILNIRTGGLAIYGAVIAGFIAALIYARIKKINPLNIIDLVAPSLILAQGIGRWANFCNQEAFGIEFVNEAMHWFPLSVYIERLDGYYAATFFYESIWCIAMFFVLLWYSKKAKHPGNVFAMYLVVYGFERMFVEGLRTDSLYIGGIRVSQLLSLLLVLAAGAYLLFRHFKANKISKPEAELDDSLKIISEEENSVEAREEDADDADDRSCEEKEEESEDNNEDKE
ncbi:MAG: prolipoprotein diacylglyceryl transferase [Clostridia bacterium]|nr:prolipoprotein diacylglyceryl transferase [Clostridia bacterium]